MDRARVVLDVLRMVPPQVRVVALVAVLVLGIFGERTEGALGYVRSLAEGGVAAAASGAAAPPGLSASELDRGDAPELPPDEMALLDVIKMLEVDDEGSPGGGYERDVFPHWRDTNGSGCNAREDALMREFEGAEVDGCRVLAGSGELVSVWDGMVLVDPADVDVDHIRALSDAWLANASTWTLEMREVFANDPANLVSVSASSNRSKGASGPDAWEPPNGDADCWYLDRYARVSVAYELTVTSPQAAALRERAEFCE